MAIYELISLSICLSLWIYLAHFLHKMLSQYSSTFERFDFIRKVLVLNFVVKILYRMYSKKGQADTQIRQRLELDCTYIVLCMCM